MHPIVEFAKRINHFGIDEKFGLKEKIVAKSGKKFLEADSVC